MDKYAFTTAIRKLEEIRDKELYNACVDPTDISSLPQRRFVSFKKSTMPKADFKRKKRTAIYSERGGEVLCQQKLTSF